VQDIASQVAGAGVVDVLRDSAGRAFSPADQFAMLTTVLAHAVEAGSLPTHVNVPALIGPPEPPPQSGITDVAWPAFGEAVLGAADEMRTRNHVPARVFVAATPLAPADFLVAAASVIREMPADHGRALGFPARVAIPRATRVATERFVAEDQPELFGGWVIHPEGFRAPQIVAMAKLQAWTLKPAER
jgi:hypothetical protein